VSEFPRPVRDDSRLDDPPSTTKDPASRTPDVMSVGELAARLGVEPKTVYAAIRRKQIPGVLRVGRLIRISRSAVLAWLSGQDREVRSRRVP
jgi:excisionase family DNA binding protein